MDGLGPTSRTVSAMVNDPDVADAIAAATQDQDQDAPPSSLRDQTPEAVLLRVLVNLVITALGGKDIIPAPVTAVDQARDRLALTAGQDVVAAMTPWALPPAT